MFVCGGGTAAGALTSLDQHFSGVQIRMERLQFLELKEAFTQMERRLPGAFVPLNTRVNDRNISSQLYAHQMMHLCNPRLAVIQLKRCFVSRPSSRAIQQ